MKGRIVNIITITFLVALAQFCLASVASREGFSHQGSSNPETTTGSNTDNDAKTDNLQVYLPREITVEDSTFRLGQIGVIRGNESLVTKACNVPLGRISLPGQKIILDRPTVLSRLACSGIPVSSVTLTGAEEVLITKYNRIIKGDDFVEFAQTFLQQNLPDASICQFIPVRSPEALVLPELSEDIKLIPRLVEGDTPGLSPEPDRAGLRPDLLTVQIAVRHGRVDDKEIAKREVTFRVKYRCRTAVTLIEIPEGAVITPENVSIETIVSNYPEPKDWPLRAASILSRPTESALTKSSPSGWLGWPYGLIAKTKMPAKTVIKKNMVSAVALAIAVKRNETVVICVESPGLIVTAVGKAMQEAHAGEYIRVRNIDSQRIILCKVNEDGTVTPIM